MNPKDVQSLTRLALFIAGFVAVFFLLRSLDLVPSALATASPGKLAVSHSGETFLSATGKTTAGSIELILALAAAGFVAWKYQKPILALITGKADATETAAVTAREKLDALTKGGMTNEQRLQFERLAVQAVYELDVQTIRRCAVMLTGKDFPRPKPKSPPQSETQE